MGEAPFGAALRGIRVGLGFKSARSFYAYLKQRENLGFNYTYYVRIEGGKVMPSATVVATLTGILKGTSSDRLTLAYCASLFPKKSHLFQAPAGDAVPGKTGQPVSSPRVVIDRQSELSEAQVALIAKSPLHYHAFILLTLARGPLPVRLIQERLKGDANADIGAILKELEALKLVFIENNAVVCTATEKRFPKAHHSILRKQYELFDRWDLEIGAKLGLNQVLKKVLLRRVSPRYVGLIVNQCNMVLDLVKTSEELQTVHNSKVMVISLNLLEGELPG